MGGVCSGRVLVKRGDELMKKPINSKTGIQIDNESEFVNIQINQALETYRNQFNLSVQALTVFVVANVTILGFAISNQIAGLLLVDALIPLLMTFIARAADKLMLPVVYVAISLEAKYGKPNTDWLASTFVSNSLSIQYIKRIREISEIDDFEERTERLKRLRVPMIGSKGVLFFALSVSLGQTLISLWLNQFFGWRFF